MGKQDKTNCMRVLESKKIPYTPHLYEADPSLSGEDIARILQEEPDQVFKTLVTTGKPQKYYVFIVPVNAELNLKKAAAAVGEKSVSMIPQRDLLPLTGVTFPFVSSGGTSMIVSWSMLAFLKAKGVDVSGLDSTVESMPKRAIEGNA